MKNKETKDDLLVLLKELEKGKESGEKDGYISSEDVHAYIDKK